MKQITIRSIRQPVKENLDADIKWFCESFGLLSERDKNRTSLKIFKTLIKGSRNGRNVSIDEISREAEVSRTAVMHHLKVMRSAGLVVKEDNSFELRMRSMQKLVDEIGLDIERILRSIREIAEDIDRRMNLPVRRRIDDDI